MRFLFADMERRAKAGKLGPSAIQKAHSYLRTFAGWIGKPGLVLPIGAYISDETLYRPQLRDEAQQGLGRQRRGAEEVIASCRRIRRSRGRADRADEGVRPALQGKR